MVIPQGEHWAIVSIKSTHIPGDERSRTHPGHGYPEHTETSILYDVFTSENEMTDELSKRSNPISGSIGIHVTETFSNIVSIRTVKHGYGR